MRKKPPYCDLVKCVAVATVFSSALAYSQDRAALVAQAPVSHINETSAANPMKVTADLTETPRQNQFDGVRTYIRAQILEHSIPSVSVAVAQHGRIIWEEGFGWANREQKIPATENTMYSLASISKPLTATGLMTLVQAHKIDLDRPINDYLGDAKLRGRVGDANGATVRRVANHTSGLPLYYQFFPSDQPFRRPSYDETILRYGNLVTVPGEHYQYANLGYGLLGYVEARVSGLSYEDFMRKEVFVRLGMTHTSVGIGPGLEGFQAVRYDGKGTPIPFYVTDHPGASEIYSSAHDLIRFAMFHLKDHLSDQAPILSDVSIDEMHRATTATDEPNDGYGIGWETIDRADGFHVVYHGGGMPGVTTLLQLVPSEDLAVVVLSDGSDVDRKGIANAIWKVLLPTWTVPNQQQQTSSQPFRPVAALIGTWKGTLHTYKSDVPAVATIAASGEIHIKVGNQLESLINNPKFQDDRLTGEANGTMDTDDAMRHHTNVLAFDLKLNENRLTGSATAESNGSDYAALTQWIELKKQ
jgi:CubicO group peptidase (beta-lactamase class C family)